MKNVVILGSTGSIGTQTLNVIGRNPDKFRVLAIVAGSNAEKLSEQANSFRPEYVGLFDGSSGRKIKFELFSRSLCGRGRFRPLCGT